MATNRYGQIWHGDHHKINIRFASTEARLKFQNEFEEYHASHDHEGDIPTFRCVSSKDLKLGTGDKRPQDLVKAETDKDYRITIDGYSWNEIHDYHNPSGLSKYTWYSVPTCCVPPIIVIDREFVDSGTLQRHKLSALFTDIPDDDFKKLCASIEANGFIDPIIRIYEGQILDGWHRYRAAKELNLIRKLKFQEWKERDEGDPAAFVLARNIERRHLTPGQRGVIVVEMNNWLERGNVKAQTDSDSPNGEPKPKSRTKLAKEAGVGERTIDRAKEVSRAGKSKEVIAGEKSMGEVLGEQKAKASAETEAEIAVVKPRFQSAVETWRSSQVERLRKFEDLPVGRTPLIESEYIKTYFELAQHRIPQNTKPTAAHYEGAIECMRDLPVAFAEQLEGRHYRRIIKEWDSSVLLQLVERFQSGHILGYPALETDSDANASRIRQAIRDHYGFEGRITSQLFEVLFEITEDAHAVLVQLNPKEWIREGREISWAVSVLPEPTYEKILAENRNKAQRTCVEMWKAFERSALSKYLDKEDFMGVAAREYQCPSEFPDPMDMKQPEIWVDRFNAITLSLAEKSGWVQRVLEDFSGADWDPFEVFPSEEEIPEAETPNTTDREASELLKEKKQALKSMWDKRIQAGKDYLGDGDTDLNQYFTLEQLEKAFPKQDEHAYCADAFRSAFQRTSETSLNIVIEKALASDVSLEVLRAEAQAMDTYAYDILQWQKQDWIQQLIEKKKAAEKAADESESLSSGNGSAHRQRNEQNPDFSEKESASETDETPTVAANDVGETERQQKAEDTHTLFDKIQNYLIENDLTYRIALIGALREITEHYNLHADFWKGEYEGMDADDLDAEYNMLSTVFVDLQNEESQIRQTLARLTTDPEPADSEPDMDTLWDAFHKRVTKWKAKYAEKGHKDNDLIQQATDADLLKAFEEHKANSPSGILLTGEPVEDVTGLMQRESFPFALRVKDIVRERIGAPVSEAQETDDASLNDLDLPSLKEGLDTMLETVGQLTHGAMRDDMRVAVFEALHSEYEGVTDRECLSILIECALSIVTENS